MALTEIQIRAAKLQGERLLSPEAVASELNLPADTVRAWESDPEYADARADALVSGAHEEAARLFGDGTDAAEDAIGDAEHTAAALFGGRQ
jgi:hypothetical protein